MAKDGVSKGDNLDGSSDLTYGAVPGGEICRLCGDWILPRGIHICEKRKPWKFCPHCGKEL